MKPNGYTSPLFGLLIFIFLGAITSGCGSARAIADAQRDIRNDFVTGNYDDLSKRLSSSEYDKIYRNNSMVLRNLELGISHRMQQNFMASNQAFENAELEIERLFGTSVERTLRALTINDGQLEYQGEDYEDIYINLFKSLNFIHMGNYEAAGVEARRMVFKMESVEDRYTGVIERVSNNELARKVGWGTGNSKIDNSALGHYLASVIFNVQGRQDNARIELERLKTAWADQMGIDPEVYAQATGLTQLHGGSFNVLFMAFTDRSPLKEERVIDVVVDGNYAKLSYPVLRQHESNIRRVRVIVNNNQTLPLFLIEDMASVATEVFEIRKPIIVARGTIRSSARAIGVARAREAATERYGTAGDIGASIFSFVAQEALETADLRSWQTLPGKAFSNVANLPPGEHTLRIEYLDAMGNVVRSQNSRINVEANKPLILSEFLYFH